LNDKEKLIPVGHNIAFDIRCVTTKLVHTGTWEQFVSHRTLDTCTIAQFFRTQSKLPKELSCSLVSLTEYFNVKPSTGKAHEADYDCLATLNVLECLKKL
jgi:DNA polymerase III alpha subunit (gram-positive type)